MYPVLPFVPVGLLKMFDIPAGARHIVIEENGTSPHIIGECQLEKRERGIAKAMPQLLDQLLLLKCIFILCFSTAAGLLQ